MNFNSIFVWHEMFGFVIDCFEHVIFIISYIDLCNIQVAKQEIIL